MSPVSKILQKIGLSDGEIKVYLAGLNLGPSMASELASSAKINRTLTYHNLELLEAKGLLRKSGPRHGQRFIMEPPSRLKSIIERKQKELGQMDKQLDRIIPELQSTYTPKALPSRVRFYEGVEGMKNVAQDALKAEGKLVYVIASIDHLLNMFDLPFLQYFLKEADKKKIKRKSIWSRPVEESLLPPSEYREQRIAPKNFVFPSTMFIYDDKVLVFSSPSEKSAFVIESAEYAQTMKALFEQLWKKSRKSSVMTKQ